MTRRYTRVLITLLQLGWTLALASLQSKRNYLASSRVHRKFVARSYDQFNKRERAKKLDRNSVEETKMSSKKESILI